MSRPLSPVPKTSLTDGIAEQILQMVRSGEYHAGDRLPAILKMAKSFGVGHPTVREALRKLEVVGVVEIRHGSGVYVQRGRQRLLVSNPTFSGGVSKDLLLMLVEARKPIEVQAISLAATHARAEHLDRMASLLDDAKRHMDDDERLSRTNMAFHAEIAGASGNEVLPHIQEVLSTLFQREQRAILTIYGSRERDHAEHRGLFEAIQQRDAPLARSRMEAHLGGVREVIVRWDPAKAPLTERAE